jgi:hypothetical protein
LRISNFPPSHQRKYTAAPVESGKETISNRDQRYEQDQWPPTAAASRGVEQAQSLVLCPSLIAVAVNCR